MARADRLRTESAAERFNRLTGRSRETTPAAWGKRISRFDPNLGKAARVRRIARGSPSVPSRVTRRYRQLTTPIGGGFRASAPRVESAINNVFERLVDQYEQNVMERDALTRIAEAETDQAVGDRPWYGDVWHAISGVGEEGEEGGFSTSIVGRGLDIASRPFYAVTGGLHNVAEQETHRGFSPGDLFHTIQNAAGGAWAGFTGEEKRGAGEVYEVYKENPEAGFGEILRDFEEEHPALEQFTAQALGLGGELFLDPLNYLLPSAPTVMRSTDIAQRAGTAGRTATGDVFRRTMMQAAGEAANDFAGSNTLAGIYRNNPDLLTARIRNSIDDTFNRANVEIHGGGRRGRRTMNSRIWPALVANRTQEEIFQATTEFFTSRVDDLWTRGKTGKYNAETVDAYRTYSNDFDEFWRELDNQLTRSGIVSANATTDDILDALKEGHVPKNVFDRARNKVLDKYAPELENVFNRVFETTRNPTYRTVGVRLGANVVPFRLPGRAYDFMGTKLADNLIPNRADTVQKLFYENEFPGIFGIKASKARALGLAGTDQFRRDLQKFARAYSNDQAKELQRLLERGVTTTGDPLMDRGLKFLRDNYDDIYNKEVEVGARPNRGMGSRYGDNYTYIYNRGGTKARRTEFKEGRKRAWNDPNTVGPEKYTVEYAKARGLKPVENAFENLYLRTTKMGRDNVRAGFLQDLVENYSSIPGRNTRRLTKREKEARGLVEVPYNRLNSNFRKMSEKEGGSFYLPKVIYDVSKKFDELSGWTSAEWGTLGRAYAGVINKIKALLTLPFVGFHMRNFLGDIFMGLLDGINPNAYTRITKKFLAASAGRTAKFTIIPKRLEYDWSQMYSKFLEYADAGFFSVEFGTYNSLSAGAIPRRVGRKVTNTIRDWSDKRETIPRFVHFVTAYEDEARALWKNGVRDIAKIEKQAADAALWRVNQFKFDYSALLPWEKGLKTLAFPFYTYLRKALPILVEQMYTNPRYLTAANRFMQYNDGSGADDFNNMNIPQWIRDIGFGLLTDEKEPMAVTADILPLGVLDILSSVSPNELNPATFDPGDFFRESLSNLNPVFQAPFEYAQGREFFGDRPIQGSFGEYITENIPFIHDFQEEVVDIPGVPGGYGNNSLFDYITGNAERPIWESLLQNRFAGVGLPIRRIRENQQFQQQQENRDRLVDDPLEQFNRSQDRISITTTSDFTFRVIDRFTGVKLGEFYTPSEAIEFASRYGSYQMPTPGPYTPPDYFSAVESL